MKSVTFLTNEIHSAPDDKRMKVRGGVKKGKRKTDLKVLARAEQTYEFGKPKDKISNRQGFCQDLATIRKVQKVLTIGQRAGTEATEAFTSVNSLLRKLLVFKGQHFEDVERDIKLFDVVTRRQKLEDVERRLGVQNDLLDKLKREVELHGWTKTLSEQRAYIAQTVDKLKTERGYWKAVKPFVTYNLVTNIEVDSGLCPDMERAKRIALGYIQGVHVSRVVVRKTWRERKLVMGKEIDECGIHFDSKSIKGLNVWLQAKTWTPLIA